MNISIHTWSLKWNCEQQQDNSLAHCPITFMYRTCQFDWTCLQINKTRNDYLYSVSVSYQGVHIPPVLKESPPHHIIVLASYLAHYATTIVVLMWCVLSYVHYPHSVGLMLGLCVQCTAHYLTGVSRWGSNFSPLYASSAPTTAGPKISVFFFFLTLPNSDSCEGNAEKFCTFTVPWKCFRYILEVSGYINTITTW